jgi:hypothetical protein
MNEHALRAVYALECARGDDLYRARSAFRNFTPAQMNEQWGQSGKTCQTILDECRLHEAKINAAIEWVKRVGEQL